MNALSEREVRDQLAAALDRLDPPPPPLDQLRTRAKRRRLIRWGGAGVLAFSAAAVVAVLVILIPRGHGDQAVRVASAPSRASLTAYAEAHGGRLVAGPYAGFDATGGYFGAFAVTRGVEVVRYGAQGWQADGPLVTSLGEGRLVQRIEAGPSGPVATSPTFAVRIIGGDVSYFGSVLARSHSGWLAATFGGCGHHGLCTNGGNSEPYGHMAGDRFVSVNNTCNPYCAAGNEYRIVWRWSPANRGYEVSSQRKA